MLEINAQLKTSIEASLKAGKAIMEVFSFVIEVEYKDDKSPLTEADKRANDIIKSFLIPTQTPILSEENKQIDYSIRKKWNKCWVVDPVNTTYETVSAEMIV